MRRRGRTVILGALLTLLIGWQIGRADVPYVELSPGPTVDTLSAVDQDGQLCTDPASPVPEASGSPPTSAPPEPACEEVIQVTGASVSSSEGQLRLVTVSVKSGLSLLEAIKGWLSGEDAVVPRKFFYPEDKTEQEVDRENLRQFEESQSTAETIALKKLGYPVQVKIDEVTAGGPSVGRLREGDIIDSVGGSQVTSIQKLIDLIRAKPVGTPLQIGYTRDGAKGTAQVTSQAGDGDTPRIGVRISSVQPHPFGLKIELDRVGGTSAGMMFALGIIDKLTPEDLTHGKIIVGTGTIDAEGNVGPIGGVTQKLYAAQAAGATIFLVPADNCAEARSNVPEGITLVKVRTLDDALAALEAIGSGRPLPSC